MGTCTWRNWDWGWLRILTQFLELAIGRAKTWTQVCLTSHFIILTTAICWDPVRLELHAVSHKERTEKVTARRRSHNNFTVNNSGNSDILKLLWCSRVSNLISAVLWTRLSQCQPLCCASRTACLMYLLKSRDTDFHRRAYILSFILCALGCYVSGQPCPQSSSQNSIAVELLSSFSVCVFFFLFFLCVCVIKDQDGCPSSSLPCNPLALSVKCQLENHTPTSSC